MTGWLRLRSDWPWRTVADLQADGRLLVEDGNHGEYRPRPAEFSAEGTPFIRAADLVDGRPEFTSAGRINDQALARIRKGIGAPGDILFSHKGTVGKVARAPLASPPFVCSPQTTFWRPLDPNTIDPGFLYTFMRSSEFVRQWTVRKGDTDMADYVSLTAQRTLLVPVPPLSIQRGIAAIVSAYDDLIETNKRRITVLEEMAQRIYREWFVAFRYPGHLDVSPAESELGPPPGWQARPLSGLATITMGQSPPSAAYNRDGMGLPFHQGVGTYGAHFPTHEVYSSAGARIAEAGDTLVSVRAPVGRINIADRRMILGRGLCGVRAGVAPATFLLHALKEVFREEDIMGGGTIFKSVTRRDMEDLRIRWPGEALAREFADIAEPIWSHIRVCTLAIDNLRAARDVLLPQLILGAIDVAGLNCAGPEAA